MISSARRDCVLVVDDDPGILRAVSRIFGQHYEVHAVGNPLEALALAPGLLPDVAVIDIRMPEMNGFELMRRLREILPDVDVILMTGNAEEPDANLVRAIDAGAFYFIQKPFERRVLIALVGRCFELRRLRFERQQHLQRLERELEEAQQFQMSLLPPPQGKIGGLSIAARYIACGELGGDLYDYLDAGGGAAALLIADVVGHGASAAMMTGVVKAAFHAAHADGFEPLGVVNRVKEGIRAFDAGRFVTLCCARVDRQAGKLAFANAGHPPAILARKNGPPRLLEATGPLISSALVDLPCEQEELTLAEHDSLLFYTDGVTEAAGPGGMFGKQRILSLFEGERLRGAQLLDSILASVSEFAGGRKAQDDITLLGAEFTAA